MPRTEPWPQEETLARIRRSARRAARGDTEATTIYNAFNERSVGVRVAPKGVMMALEAKQLPAGHRAYIVIVQPQEVENLPSPPPEACFQNGDKIYFIDRAPWTEWYLGVVVLHEMVHWYDTVHTGWEKPDVQFSDEWVKGEVHAHKLESRALNRLTKTLWLNHAVSIFDNPSMRLKYIDNLLIPSKIGLDHVLSTLPDVPECEAETASRTAAALTEILFAQCTDDAQRAAAYRLHQKLGPDLSQW